MHPDKLHPSLPHGECAYSCTARRKALVVISAHMACPLPTVARTLGAAAGAAGAAAGLGGAAFGVAAGAAPAAPTSTFRIAWPTCNAEAS